MAEVPGNRAARERPVLLDPLPPGVPAAGHEPVVLRWQLPGATSTQRRCELQAAPDPSFAAPWAHAAATPSTGAVLPGPALRSREVRYARVRVDTGTGWTPWSDPVPVEAGLLDPADWTAVAVTLPGDPGSSGPGPAPMLRTEFDLPGPVERARLHVTALGVHRTLVNGRPVAPDLLQPGWTPYRRRLLAATYDVTGLLTAGRNALAAVLGDGWYRGRLGWQEQGGRNLYGSEVGLLAQLEVRLADGTQVVVATGPHWRAATGEIRAAELYDGVDVDLRLARPGWDRPGFDDRDWLPARVVPLDLAVVEPQAATPVRVVARLPARLEPRPSGLLLDAGQNCSGVVRLTVAGRAGETVTVRHAEVLEPDGSLHTWSLRTARATDTYVLAGDEPVVLEPAFTVHGFRYAEVATAARVLDAEVLALSSAVVPRARFTCSDPRLERLHENARWSQLSNFLAVPTDCPQRDERLGWTGDVLAFAPAACTLFDVRPFLGSWLRDLALEQRADGAVATLVPDVVITGGLAAGRAGWADAATGVPWAVYESYGDTEVLRRQLPSMVAWVEHLQARLGPRGLLGPEEQFGDWLDPDAPPDRPWEAKTDPQYLANAFAARSAALLARAAGVLGDGAVAGRAAGIADRLRRLTWARWREHALSTQTGCAAAICFDLAPPGERAEAGAALAALVRAGAGRIATGFLGTPLVLPALTATGHLAEAYLMLLREELPSWLYQVRHGATTIWERWDAIRPDGSIHDGGTPPERRDPSRGFPSEGNMLSFNHYAYGVVVDWMYRTLAGLAPDPDLPGYARALLAPRPVAGVTHASASVDGVLGPVEAGWEVDAGVFRAAYALPGGGEGRLDPPVTAASVVTVDGREVPAGPVTLGPGRHAVTVTAPRVVDPGPGPRS